MKKKIAVIGANEFQLPLIKKAKAMGYETHVFAWSQGAVGESEADFFYPISIIEVDSIYEECKIIKPVAVVTIASDVASVTVNELAKKMGFIHNSDRSVKVSTNKYAMREAFKTANIPTPLFAIAADDKIPIEICEMKFPMVVKPTDRSGSRGIRKVNYLEELEEAIITARECSFEKKVVIEEFIEGDEYSCECISFEGKHHFLALTKKYTTGSPHFIEIAHCEPAGFTKEQEMEIVKQIFCALDALDIQYGASHSEFKIDKNGTIRIIEIGARMGGDCIGSDLVRISTGKDYLKMVIEVATGMQPCLEKESTPLYTMVRFVMGQDDLDLLEQIRMEQPELIVRESAINITGTKVEDSSTRYGFYIISSSKEDDIRKMLP